jgi:hypothetical protein
VAVVDQYAMSDSLHINPLPMTRKCRGAPTRCFSLVRSQRGALQPATEMTADIYWIRDVAQVAWRFSAALDPESG